MRPVRLVMENIGPFSGRTEVDFGALPDIFLVTGKTGSGKSTIFDSLCYALYGSLPGARRGYQRRIRSDFAGEDQESKVSLEFELEGKRYLVQRRPPRLRKKRRGEGYVEEGEDAALFELGPRGTRPLSAKKTEADEAIRNLIGLSEEEFSKVILLPQGEFAEFLRQGTKDRREVLKKLFPVDLADRVKDLAGERAKEATARLREAERSFAELASRFDAEGFASRRAEAAAELDAAKARIEEGRKSIEELAARERAADAARERAERLLEARTRLEELEGGRGAMAEDQARAESSRAARTLLPLLMRHDEARNAATKADEAAREAAHEAAEAAAGANAAEARLPEADKHSARAAALRERRGVLAEAADAEASLAEDEAELRERRKVLEKLEGAREALAERRRTLSAEAEQAAAAAAEARVVDAEYDRARDGLDEARKALQAAQKAAEVRSELETARHDETAAGKRLEEAERALTTLSAERERLESKRREDEDAQRAAVLATRLVPGEPCPVCGSRDHPAPAAAAPYALDLSTRIAAMDASRAEAQETLQAGRIALAAVGARRERAERELVAIGAEEGGPSVEDASAAVKELAERLNGCLERRRTAAAARESVDRLRRDIDAVDAEGRDLGERRTAAKAELSALESSAATRRERLRKALSSIAGSGTGGAPEAGLDGLPDGGSADGSGSGVELRARAALEALDGELRTLEDEERRIRTEAQEARSAAGAAAARAVAARQESERAAESSGRSGAELKTALEASPFADAGALRAAALDESAERALLAAVRERERAFDAARAQVEELERAAADDAGLAGTDMERLGALLSEAREKLEREGEARDRAAASAAALDRDKAEWDLVAARRSALASESATLKVLADDLSGANPRRMPFDAYLLAMYLEEVATYASARLERMSEGRFKLVLDSQAATGNAQSGLDLVVFDSFTGRTRPCATLSGGESFMASISLALGLADSIQSRSGGVRLDAVFIDEGFGSLDEASLDRALTILDEVRGSRMVGLISHVGELRSRIPARIEVVKASQGSRVRIVS